MRRLGFDYPDGRGVPLGGWILIIVVLTVLVAAVWR